MPDPATDSLDERLDVVARHPFRAKFHLRGRDRATAELNGPATVRRHASELITRRLAPAEPYKDGKQTPLPRPPGLRRPARHRHLLPLLPAALAPDPQRPGTDPGERDYVVDIVLRWIQREMTNPPAR